MFRSRRLRFLFISRRSNPSTSEVPAVDFCSKPRLQVARQQARSSTARGGSGSCRQLRRPEFLRLDGFNRPRRPGPRENRNAPLLRGRLRSLHPASRPRCSAARARRQDFCVRLTALAKRREHAHRAHWRQRSRSSGYRCRRHSHRLRERCTAHDRPGSGGSGDSRRATSRGSE